MIQENEILYFLSKYENPVVIVGVKDEEIIYTNEKAKENYGFDKTFGSVQSVLKNQEEFSRERTIKMLKDNGFAMFYDIYTVKKQGQEMLCDIQIDYFNEERSKIFIEIREKLDVRLLVALNQIHQSSRAEAVLNFDEVFSVVRCNEVLLEVFGGVEFSEGDSFFEVFPSEVGDKLREKVFSGLSRGKNYAQKVQVFTEDDGEEQWYLMELERRVLDNSGSDKIMLSMTNIGEQVELEEERSHLHQYLDAFQAVSEESFCIINLEKRTITQTGKVARELGVEGVMENFPECTFSYVHPDDLDNFKIFSDKTMAGETVSAEARMKDIHGEYQWYEVRNRGLRDKSGKLTELVGKISNVHKKKMAQDEFSEMNKYFEVLQTFSDDILYRIDLSTMTLHHSIQSERVKVLGNPITDYLNTMVTEVVHPDDVEGYLRGNEAWMLDENVEMEIRFALISEEYDWYRVKGKKIFDGDGNIVEVVGVLINVQKEKTMESEVSLLSQYFETMQSLSDESIYVYELETGLLHLGGLTVTELGLPLVMQGYPECLFSCTHPEDVENLKEFAGRGLSCKESRLELRLLNVDGYYQWYELISIVIDGKGEAPTHILGKVKNIQKEKTMQAEVTSMNKYFDVMQEFSSDIIYRIDVLTGTLYHAYQSGRMLEIGMVVPNYLETFVKEEIVHPEDADEYVRNTKAWLLDDSVECEARFNLFQDYELYSVKRRKIFDDDGNLIEILGALVSVQKERDLAREFENSRKYFEIMQELSDDIYYRIDADSMTLHHNFESEHEITKQKSIPDYVNTFIREKIIHPDDVEQYVKDLTAFNEDELVDIPARFSLFDEEYHWYKARGRKILDENDNVVEIWGRLINEHEEKEAKSELNAVSQQFNAMQNLSSDILFHVDIDTRTFYHNEANSLAYGLPAVIPNYVEFFIAKGFVLAKDVEMYRENMEKLHRCEISSFQTRLMTVGKVYEWHELRCEPLFVEGNRVTQLFGRLRNIQSQRNLEERAYHDLMTGALNKVSFEEEAGRILAESEETDQHALIFIDLDDFKGVNDTLGHSYGDALLTTVGKRLKRLVRGDDLVGRIGGDEFAVMLRNVDSENSVMVRTNLMLEALQYKFTFEEKVIGIKASVGVAVYPQHGKNYKELIGKSDIAVYESKRLGKNMVSMYSEHLEEY